MASLGQLVIELAANTARLQTDMGKAVGIAERGAAQMKKAFTFVTGGLGGGLIGAALIGAAKQAIEFGDNINKAAIKAGTSVKAMSELAYAAKLADVDIGALSTGIKKMQVAFSEASSGAKQPRDALAVLGLTIEEIQKRKPEAQFELLADRISKLKDPADRARAATELFGKAGADLLPLFDQGAAGISKAVAEARKLGLAFSESDIAALSNADDATKRLSASWEGFAAVMTAKVAPSISSVLDTLSGIDTRSTAEKISDLQNLVTPRGVRRFAPGQFDAFKQQLSNLQGLRDLEQVRAAQTGTSGGPTQRNGGSGISTTYAAIAAQEAAAEAAKKASADEIKETEDRNKTLVRLRNDMYGDLDRLGEAAVHKDLDRFANAETEKWEDARDMEEKIAEFRAEQAAKLSESAQIFRDAFLNAFDDMINTGKLKFGELIRYIAAQLTRSALVKLFDSGFSQGNSGGGWLGTALGALGSAFTGSSNSSTSTASWIDDFKANGGPVQAGKSYLVGERGMEVFRPSSSGTIVPNNALGSSVHIDARIIMNGNNGISAGELQRAQSEQSRRIFDEIDRRNMTRLAA